MSERLPTPRLVGMMAGLWIWAFQFTLVYGFTAFACTRGYADETFVGFNIVRLFIAVVTAICLLLDLAVLLPFRRAGHRAGTDRRRTSGDGMVSFTTITTAALAFVAIAYTGLPALIVPVCR